jgi:hypothetical protein
MTRLISLLVLSGLAFAQDAVEGKKLFEVKKVVLFRSLDSSI